ncbi:MAG TPA: glycosyltransferase family 4 protein [Vicinamibacteria bacterium]|nr:glycosyltransferase family 4 protein [Vicinamibacteria bacterium]
MKLLYVASDQRVPGSTGGAVHVEEVAMGLESLGHEVHVVAIPSRADTETELRLHRSPLWLRHRAFRWLTKGFVGELMEELGADAVIERYYNFGGEGIRAAFDRGLPSLLEVNSPLKDHAGSIKQVLDALMLVHPMKRARDELVRKASALVTPLPEIVPDSVPREKVHRVSWGANVERFRPEVAPKPLEIPSGSRVVVFAGSFRPWHGADLLVRAAPLVLEKIPSAFFLLVGSGPSRPRRVSCDRVLFTGAVPYADMPGYLRLAEVGVAPYQPSRLGQMKLGFYWSPLKIFEYMATGLPVVTLDVAPLREIVRPGSEGVLVPEGNVRALAEAITLLLENPERARTMGASARARVVERFSWRRHCGELDQILRDLVGAS